MTPHKIPADLRAYMGFVLGLWLEDTGTSRKEIAGAVNVSQPHISMIEAGKRAPSVDLQAKVERVLARHPGEWRRRAVALRDAGVGA